MARTFHNPRDMGPEQFAARLAGLVKLCIAPRAWVHVFADRIVMIDDDGARAVSYWCDGAARVHAAACRFSEDSQTRHAAAAKL